MASIYNFTHSNTRGRGRGGIPNQRPMHNTLTGNGTPSRFLPADRPITKSQNTVQTFNIPYQDYQLTSTKRRGKNHVMDFRTAKVVDFKNFARPVKLQRKDADKQNYHRHFGNNKTAGNTPGGAAGATATGESSSSTSSPHYGPKTGADTSLIAPLGGATRNKQMLFKKRTKQIFLAKDDVRELKEQETKPWILEDYDGQNSFTGVYEGSKQSDYVFFVLTENGFKVVPVDRWYKFQAKRNFKTLTLEEAEEQLKKQQRREQNRWMMLKRNQALAEAEEQKAQQDQMGRSKVRIGTENSEKRRGQSRDDDEMDELDFEDVFQDDEEGGGEFEFEDEEMKESKERLKRETKGYIPGDYDDEDDLFEEKTNKLSSDGKQMRKLVRDLENNRAYESDEEVDPYASSEDEVESDTEKKEEVKTGQDTTQQKKAPQTQKRKATAPAKPPATKKTTAAKVKKEELPRPSARPGSPSVHIKKEPSLPSPPPGGTRGPSPLHAGSPVRTTIDTTSAAAVTATSKKRKAEEGASNAPDAKHRIVNHPAPSSPSGGSHAIPSSTGGPKDEDIITEEEVIATLRGKKMTLKEFLMHFRKRIKKNERNREIITGLLKKVARHNSKDDPNTKTLELRPELQ